MSKKFTYEYVLEYFKKNGCKLLSESYLNANSKLKYVAKCGHEHSILLYHFKQGQGVICPRCAHKILGERQKLSYEDVKNCFKENGCKLLSESYTNRHSKLRYIAKCGHEHFIALRAFRSGQGRMCPKCAYKAGSEKKKFSYEDVREYFKENGVELLSERYVGALSKLRYIAKCGHEHFISLANFKSGKGRICPTCTYKIVGDNKTLSYKNVKKTFEEHGCKLLSKKYLDARSKLKYVAMCGHENLIALYSFKSGQGRMCSKCAMPSGKDNYMWNPNLTDKDRIRGRFTKENAIWRKSVYKRDNYTCQITGEKGGSIVAHHMKPYYKYKDLRSEISNGITLNKEFHIFAHKIFGQKAEIGYGELIEAQYLYSKREDNNV